jgi:hypothetical protein
MLEASPTQRRDSQSRLTIRNQKTGVLGLAKPQAARKNPPPISGKPLNNIAMDVRECSVNRLRGIQVTGL